MTTRLPEDHLGPDLNGIPEVVKKAPVQLVMKDTEKIPEFVAQQTITERGSLKIETPAGTFYARVVTIEPDPDAHIHQRDEWDSEHITFNSDHSFNASIHAHELNSDSTHGMVQLPWVGLKPGVRYGIAVFADENNFTEPVAFTDEPIVEANNFLGQIKFVIDNEPMISLKSGTRTKVYATSIRVDGAQPLNVLKAYDTAHERLTILARPKDELTGLESGDAQGVFTGLVEDTGYGKATMKPLIIEDAPANLPNAGTAASQNGLTTIVLYETETERVTQIKRVKNPNYVELVKSYDVPRGGTFAFDFNRSLGPGYSESKTVFGQEQVIETNTVKTTGNKGMAAAFQFRIVVEKSVE